MTSMEDPCQEWRQPPSKLLEQASMRDPVTVSVEENIAVAAPPRPEQLRGKRAKRRQE